MGRFLSPQSSGLLAIFFAMATWAILVIYYSKIPELTGFELGAHRIVWSFLFTGILVTVFKQWPMIGAILHTPKELITVAACGVLIGINWLAFVLAVTSGHTLEASMGSYLNPMLGIAAARFWFKEHIRPLRKAALLFAVTGVAYMILGYGKIPWYALGISIPFMLYSAVHKSLKVSVLDGFFLEMSVLIVPAFLYLVVSGGFSFYFTLPAGKMAFITLVGPLSAVPLIMFNYGVQRLEFTTVNFIQYVHPTVLFFLAVYYFGEPLGQGRLVVFAFIWIGVLLFLLDSLMQRILIKKMPYR